MSLVPMQGEGLVLAVAFSISVHDPDGVGAGHVPTWQLAGGNRLFVVVHIAHRSLYGLRPSARVVVHSVYLGPVLLQFNKVSAELLDLVTDPPMDKADEKL